MFAQLRRRLTSNRESPSAAAHFDAEGVALGGLSQGATGLAFTLAANALVAGDETGQLIVWDLQAGAPARRASEWQPAFRQRFEHNIRGLAATTSGELYFGQGPGLTNCDLTSETLRSPSALPCHQIGAAHDKSLSTVLLLNGAIVSGGDDGQLIFRDLNTRQVKGGHLGSPIRSLAATHDEHGSVDEHLSAEPTLLACGHDDGSVTIVELSEGQPEPVGRFATHDHRVDALAWQATTSAGTMCLATFCRQQEVVRLWQRDSMLAEFKGATGGLAFSPDGTCIAHGHGHEVWLRAGQDLAPCARLRGLRAPVEHIVVAAPAQAGGPHRLAATSSDGAVRVWNLADMPSWS